MDKIEEAIRYQHIILGCENDEDLFMKLALFYMKNINLIYIEDVFIDMEEYAATIYYKKREK